MYYIFNFCGLSTGRSACRGADDRNNGPNFHEGFFFFFFFVRVDRRGIGSLFAKWKIEVAAKTSLSQITSFRPIHYADFLSLYINQRATSRSASMADQRIYVNVK